MRRVCITIDTEFPDRPCSDPLDACIGTLEALGGHGTPATFFVVGDWARANPDRVRAIADGGHLVGNHSYSHCNLSRMTDAGIVEDLTECHQALAELGVESRPWFRAPYGEMTSNPRVRRAVKRAGYRHVPWHVDSGDWRTGADPEEIAERTLTAISRRWPRTANVLFHSWPDASPYALSVLLDRLIEKRATFITPAQRRRGRLLVS